MVAFLIHRYLIVFEHKTFFDNFRIFVRFFLILILQIRISIIRSFGWKIPGISWHQILRSIWHSSIQACILKHWNSILFVNNWPSLCSWIALHRVVTCLIEIKSALNFILIITTVDQHKWSHINWKISLYHTFWISRPWLANVVCFWKVGPGYSQSVIKGYFSVNMAPFMLINCRYN